MTVFSVVIAGLGITVLEPPGKTVEKPHSTLSLSYNYYPVVAPSNPNTSNSNRKLKTNLLMPILGIIILSPLANYLATKIFWKRAKKLNKNPEIASDTYSPFNKIPEGIIILVADDKIDYINSKAQEIFGYSIDEIKDQNIKTIIPDIFKNSYPEKIGKDIKGNPLQLEILIQDFEDDKKLLLIRNIEDSKRTVIALEKELKSYISIADVAELLVLFFDSKGKITKINSVCEKISGYSLEEIQGKYFWEVFSIPGNIQEAKNIFKRLKSGECPINYQSYCLNKQGYLFLIEWSNTVLLDQNGRVECILASGIDMTHEEKTEKPLQELNQHIEEVVAKKTKTLEKINEELNIEINQREGIEKALQRELELLSSIMETSPVAIIVLEPQGNIILANAQSEKFLGLIKNQNLEKTLERMTDHEGNIIPNDELPLQQVLNTGKPVYDLENSLEWSDGRKMFLSINGVPLFNKNGVLEAVILTLEDVTKRVQADSVKEELISRNQSLIDALGEIVYEYDLTANTIHWSGNHTKVLGYKEEEMGSTRQNWLKKIYPDDRDLVEEELAQALAEKRIFDMEYRLRCKDGSYRWIHDRGSINQDSYGRMIGVILDISERKNAEAALKESEEKFRGLVENINQVFWISSSDPREIVYISPTYEQIWGRSCESLYSKPASWIESIHPADRERITQALDKMIFDGEFAETYRIIKPDGSVRWVSIRSSAIRNSDEEIIRHIGIAEDITYRVESEKALQEANQKLTEWVTELEQRNQDMACLERMNDFLQSCMKVEEAHSLIGDLIKPMFSGSSGGVFTIDGETNLVEAIATWGESISSDTVFAVDQCWALRQGHPHSINCYQPKLFCEHIHKQPHPARTLCVPMIAQGKAVGLLYICFPNATKLGQARENFARTVAEQLSLALANLQLRETLHQQSIRDTLTGLYNRRHMEASLEREIKKAQRKGYPLSVVMVDIDHFKRFNDNFGHDAGDAVLREVGGILNRHIRGGDIACRYGGEELILILPEASLEDSYKRTEQIRKLIKGIDLEHHGQSLGTITASFGIACFSGQGKTVEEVIKAADRALYQAKAQGRDRTICHTELDENKQNFL